MSNVKVTLSPTLICECGFAMMQAGRPNNHLVCCCNNTCPHHGVFYEPPKFELSPSGAHGQVTSHS